MNKLGTKGRLGNQMFQYASAKRLAHVHQTELKMDTENPCFSVFLGDLGLLVLRLLHRRSLLLLLLRIVLHRRSRETVTTARLAGRRRSFGQHGLFH